MAQYEYTFENDTEGAAPSDITYVSTDTNVQSSEVVSDVDASNGKAWLIDAENGTENYWTFDKIPSANDFEVLMRIKKIASAGMDIRPLLRASGTGSTDVGGYTLGVREPDLDINKYLSGSFSNLNNSSSTHDPAQDVWWLQRARVNGTTLSVSAWEDGTGEPGSFEVTDTDSDIASGLAGLLDYGGGNVHIDWITITDAGETATEPGASSTPSITSVTDSDTTADQITEGENATAQLSEAATVTGAELQNSGGTRVATLPIQSSTSDSVTVQGARGQLRYGDTDNKIVLTLDDSSTIEYTGITFAAPANVTYVNGTSADTTSDNSFAKGMSSTPSDYQGAFTGDGSINPVINSDLTVASVEEPGTGTFELYDNSDGTWGSSATYELALNTTVTLITRVLRRSLVVTSLKQSLRSTI